MSKFLLLIFLYSCSQVSIKHPEKNDVVSVDAALNHIQASYMLGCVEAFRELKVPVSFEICRDKAKFHHEDVRTILGHRP